MGSFEFLGKKVHNMNIIIKIGENNDICSYILIEI